MKSFPCLLVFVLSVAPGFSFAAQDAAIEAQEGSVEHWIEYYKKERGNRDDTVTVDPPAAQPKPSGAGEAQPQDRIDQAPSDTSDDH